MQNEDVEDRALRRILVQYYMKRAFPWTSTLLVIAVMLVSMSGTGKGIDVGYIHISPLDVTAVSLVVQMVQNFINQVFTLMMVMNNSLFGNKQDKIESSIDK